MEELSTTIRKENIRNLQKSMDSLGISLSNVPLYWLLDTDFFTAPASTKYHGCYLGGLFDHSMNVVDELLRLDQIGASAPWTRKESPFIVGLLHDVTKIGLYVPNTDTVSNGPYKVNPEYKSYGGHGNDSVCKILQHMELTTEEMYCIRYHMGAYETDAWNKYDEAIRLFPNVLWTHTADMVASKLLEG